MATNLKTPSSSMQLKNYNVYFFFGILTLVSFATFFIFQPFLVAIVVAAILAVLFQRTYNYLLSITGQSKSISSLITSLMILLLLIIPVTFVSVLVGKEIIAAFQSVAGNGDFYQNYVQPFASRLGSWQLYRTLDLERLLGREAFLNYSAQFGQVVLSFVQSAYLSLTHVIFLIFVVFFSLYYFFIDGKDIVKKIMYISPLKDLHEKLLIEKFISISRATIKGTLIICLLQGTIGAVAFAIAGIPSVITWGVAMMFLSLIPLFGSGIIWLPAAIILLILGHIWQGIFMLIVGFGVISVVDNLIKPKLVGRDVQMHPLLVFFATLGGLATFGFMGFVLGPIIIALFVSLWDIYGVEFKGQLKKYNN
jgi:predicted PurR-regulated permease PerM